MAIGPLFLLPALLFLQSLTSVNSDCRKSFIYNPKYNYGYDIYCTRTTTAELSTTMANNELTLTIVNSSLTFTKATFRYLKKLRQLNITNSHISFDPTNLTIPYSSTDGTKLSANVFSILTNLETLVIQQSNITSKAAYLAGLSKLKTLILDGNRLESIPIGQFQDLKLLNKLSLKNNGIKRIQDIPICELDALDELNLSENVIAILEPSDLKCLKQLKVLNLNGNSLKQLRGITSSSLNILNLRFNRISSMAAIDTPNLTVLDIGVNRLTNIQLDGFKGFNNLVKLHLDCNNLTSVNLENKLLTYLDLSHNKLSKTPHLPLENLTQLKLSYNGIRSIGPMDFTQLNNLEILEITNNTIMDIHSESLRNVTKLKTLNLSDNLLQNISMVFVKQSNLSVFNLSHNLIDTLSRSWFANLGKLKTLDISYNKLKILNETVFEPLESLELLNLSNNLLSELSYKLIEPLENLRILDVDSNLIKELDYSSIVNELPNLDAFKAKNNLLTCEFLTKMIHYFKDNDITFSLNENLDYDKENVEGIYCKETENKLLRLEKTEEALRNNTKMLNALFSMYNNNDGLDITLRAHDYTDAHSYTLSGGEVVITVLALISLVVILTVALQKALLWHKRRNYLVDELELITNEPYKRLSSI